MARNEIDLHDTHGKPDELSAEEVARLVQWWEETALPLMQLIVGDGAEIGNEETATS